MQLKDIINKITIESLKELISSQLTSTTWAKVKNSLLGKELITLGAHICKDANDIADRVDTFLDYKNADDLQLISLAESMDIPLMFDKPSIVKISNPITDNYFALPYSMMLKIGNVVYYNIESVTKTQGCVTLYQGNLRSLNTSSTKLISWLPDGALEDTWTDTYFSNFSNTFSKGQILDKAIPNSIYEYVARDGYTGGVLVSRWTALNKNQEYLFKVKTLFDKKICCEDINFGEYTNRQLCYLEPTYEVVDLDNAKLYINGTEKDFTIYYSEEGQENDIEYARNQITQERLKERALVSKSQIYNFVKAYDYVDDCRVTVFNQSVFVYLKLNSLGEDTWVANEVINDLQIYGSLSLYYLVQEGVPIKYQIVVTNAPTEYQTGIQNLILALDSNEDKLMDEYPNLYQMNNEIYNQFGISLNCGVQVNSEAIQTMYNNYLCFLPKPSSMAFSFSGGKKATDNGYGEIHSFGTGKVTIANICMVHTTLFDLDTGKKYGIDFNGYTPEIVKIYENTTTFKMWAGKGAQVKEAYNGCWIQVYTDNSNVKHIRFCTSNQATNYFDISANDYNDTTWKSVINNCTVDSVQMYKRSDGSIWYSFCNDSSSGFIMYSYLSYNGNMPTTLSEWRVTETKSITDKTIIGYLVSDNYVIIVFEKLSSAIRVLTLSNDLYVNSLNVTMHKMTPCIYTSGSFIFVRGDNTSGSINYGTGWELNGNYINIIYTMRHSMFLVADYRIQTTYAEQTLLIYKDIEVPSKLHIAVYYLDTDKFENEVKYDSAGNAQIEVSDSDIKIGTVDYTTGLVNINGSEYFNGVVSYRGTSKGKLPDNGYLYNDGVIFIDE